MSTHGRGGLSRLLHGSVAEYLIQRVSVPVVLVTSQCRLRWPTGSQLTIVVPLDGSAFAEEALLPAQNLAGLLHAEIVLVHAIKPDEIDDAPVLPTWMDASSACSPRRVARWKRRPAMRSVPSWRWRCWARLGSRPP